MDVINYLKEILRLEKTRSFFGFFKINIKFSLLIFLVSLFLVGCVTEEIPSGLEDLAPEEIKELPKEVQQTEKNIIGQASRKFGKCLDPDAASLIGKKNELLTVSTTTFSGGSFTDSCYVWKKGPCDLDTECKKGYSCIEKNCQKTRLIEGTCRRNKFKYGYYYDCSKLNNAKSDADYHCVNENPDGGWGKAEGHCVNVNKCEIECENDQICLQGTCVNILNPRKTIPSQSSELNVAGCLIQWQDEVENTPTDIFDGLSTEDIPDLEVIFNKVKEFYQEVSLNKVNFNYQFVDGGKWEGNLPESGWEQTRAAIQACDPLLNFANVDIFLLLPKIFGTKAIMTENYVNTQEGVYQKNVVNIAFLNYNNNLLKDNLYENDQYPIFVHEMGHALGSIGHANALDCEGTPFSKEGCTHIEYGNAYDVMGRTEILGHFNGWFKYIFGWISQQTITTDGTYVLYSLENETTGVQLLRVPFEQNPVCLEYRKPVGEDDFLAKGISKVSLPEQGCLIINLCYHNDLYGMMETELLDTKPGTGNSGLDFVDSCLNEDELFINEDLGLSISYVQETDKSIAVKIDLDENKAVEPLVHFSASGAGPGKDIEIIISSELAEIDNQAMIFFEGNPVGIIKLCENAFCSGPLKQTYVLPTSWESGKYSISFYDKKNAVNIDFDFKMGESNVPHLKKKGGGINYPLTATIGDIIVVGVFSDKDVGFQAPVYIKHNGVNFLELEYCGLGTCYGHLKTELEVGADWEAGKYVVEVFDNKLQEWRSREFEVVII
jgi:hypothetical protein